MSFINNPNQFPSSGNDLGTVSIAGAASVALVLNEKIAIAPHLAGAGTVALALGTTNGIQFARAEGSATLSIQLNQEITDTQIQAAGASELKVFLRLNNEPNIFLDNVILAGQSNIELDFEPERLLFIRMEGTSQAFFAFPFELIQPDAVLNEIASGAFNPTDTYKARVKNGASELPIKSISINAPRGGVGKTINIELASKNISVADKDGSFKVEIGKSDKPYGAFTYHTVLDTGELDSRNYQMAWLKDQLSFGVIAPLSDRLNRCPKSNLIVYDPARVQVSINDFQTIYDIAGNGIITTLEPIPTLSLYQLLNIAFVSGCGFDEVRTNVPNSQLTRCDFTIKESWYQAVKKFLGPFETIIFAVGNVLWIIDKTQAIPDDFTPRTISPDTFLNWNQAISSQPPIDGFILQYVESNTNANAYTEREETPPDTDLFGSFGDSDYSYKSTVRRWRDYFNSDNPTVVLDSVLIYSQETTYKGLTTVINRDTENYTYDSQGKRTNVNKTSEKLVPDLADSGNPSLQTVQTEKQSLFYKTDRFNPGRMIQDKTVTQISGMIAVDSDNKYFDQDFKQSYADAHKAGNLKDGMTSESGAIKTVIETYVQLGNGQVQVITESVDFVRQISNTSNDVRIANPSVNSISGKLKELIIWKDGQSATSRDGNPLETFAVGELPLYFALPLATRTLARREAKKEQGTLLISGYDESIERGTYFGVLDRDGDLIGNFIVEGYSADGEAFGDGFRFRTRLDVTEV